jgi:hypothetical protein
VVTGEKNSPTVTHTCRKRRLKWVLCACGYNWDTQSPGDINMDTWSSRLGVGAQGYQPCLYKKFKCYRNLSNCLRWGSWGLMFRGGGEAYKLWNSSLYSLVQPSSTSSLLVILDIWIFILTFWGLRCKLRRLFHTCEGVSKSFRTCRLQRELQMVQLFATRCSCIAILWVSLVNFAAITFCIAS